ncbi:MAG: SCO family protein [Roseiflexus sp.]|nr:SCO family protein [Roseiflexus sp.]MCS7288345.1 SCO family protein [Roseiflexus sp.]MDW8148958.1 SCO family protein [Roseiflexaceae bacterium]MDW8233392.1 SCO family protein [Roseiflexaceae bacterium]
MLRNVQRLLLLTLLILVSACSGYEFRGMALDPPKEAPDFTLTDFDGRPFRLSDHRGKVVILFFGFTNCPDMCPAALSNMAAARRKLGADAKEVQGVFVSLDPDRDTPERLKRYLTAFDPTFIGVRGSEAELAPIVKDYGVTYMRRDLPGSALGYTIDHSTFIYVIDAAGRWRLLFAHGMPVDDIVSDLRYLVRHGGA